MAIVRAVAAIFEIEMKIGLVITIGSWAEDRREACAGGGPYPGPERVGIGLLEADLMVAEAEAQHIDCVAMTVLGELCAGEVVAAAALIGVRVSDTEKLAVVLCERRDVVSQPIGDLLAEIAAEQSRRLDRDHMSVRQEDGTQDDRRGDPATTWPDNRLDAVRGDLSAGEQPGAGCVEAIGGRYAGDKWWARRRSGGFCCR